MASRFKMAFWGVEVKCGKPVTHYYDPQKGRLHITQATLGLGSSEKKSVMQCNVGENPGVLLCALLPGKTETCSLNLEFAEEEEEVIFSVLGPTSVHLTGYYMQPNEQGVSDTDTSGEDICGASEDFSDSSEDEYEDDFIDDDDAAHPSRVSNSGVKIEEIEDEEPAEECTKSVSRNKKMKKRKAVVAGNGATFASESIRDGKEDELGEKSNGDVKNELDEKQIEINKLDGSENEDEDGLPVPSKRKNGGDGETEPPQKKQATDGKCSAATDSVKQAPVNVPSENKSLKKKKKKAKNKENEKRNAEESEGINGMPNKGSTDSLKTTDETLASLEKKGERDCRNNTRTFPNGLVVEELSMGKPDGKKASPGSKVSVYYTGKLKKNGKIFDSNIGRKPFQFRLGVGDVISGWDVGVNGMRIGDKRRLTIPPSMGYGAKGAGEIPGNAWLEFVVELVNVK